MLSVCDERVSVRKVGFGVFWGFLDLGNRVWIGFGLACTISTFLSISVCFLYGYFHHTCFLMLFLGITYLFLDLSGTIHALGPLLRMEGDVGTTAALDRRTHAT